MPVPVVLKDNSTTTPSTFLLTPKSLEEFSDLRDRAPGVFTDLVQLVVQSKDELFVPYFTQVPDDLLEFEFERSSYLFFPYRIRALSCLLQVLGSTNFLSQYLRLMATVADRFTQAAPRWGLDKNVVAEAFKTYLATSVRLLSVIGEPPRGSQEQQTVILKAITKADFGLTAVALAFEGTVFPEKTKVVRTFQFTTAALSEYVSAVTEILKASPQSNPVAGSLKIEGDLDSQESQPELPMEWPKRNER
jgi:hypothetical protein